MKMHHIRQKVRSAGLALLVALVAAGASPVATAADSGWSILSLPIPAVAPTGQLLATSCTSATACTAVGVAADGLGLDRALAERWNGTSWEGQSIPSMATDAGTFFAGVSCPSASICTAVGNVLKSSNQRMTLAERWNGQVWEVQPTPDLNGTLDSFLSATSCASTTVCTAVGYAVTGAGQKVTLAERWDGGGWHVQSSPNAAGQSDNILSGVSCASAFSCTAVGKSTSNFVSSALIEHWDGASWQIQVAAPKLRVPRSATSSLHQRSRVERSSNAGTALTGQLRLPRGQHLIFLPRSRV
jgi:hypothetical protein